MTDVIERTGITHKRKQQAAIQRQIAAFKASGGKIQQLESQQLRPLKRPCFNWNPGTVEGFAR